MSKRFAVFIIANVNREKVFLFDSEYQTGFLKYIMTNSSSNFKKAIYFIVTLTSIALVACGGQSDVADFVPDSGEGQGPPA